MWVFAPKMAVACAGVVARHHYVGAGGNALTTWFTRQSSLIFLEEHKSLAFGCRQAVPLRTRENVDNFSYRDNQYSLLRRTTTLTSVPLI
jgi:hypothetical protein